MCPWFDSRTRRHVWVEFVVGSLLCSERFFSGYSGFPSPQQTNQHFQIPTRSWSARARSCEHFGGPWLNKLQIYIFIYRFLVNNTARINVYELIVLVGCCLWSPMLPRRGSSKRFMWTGSTPNHSPFWIPFWPERYLLPLKRDPFHMLS